MPYSYDIYLQICTVVSMYRIWYMYMFASAPLVVVDRLSVDTVEQHERTDITTFVG